MMKKLKSILKLKISIELKHKLELKQSIRISFITMYVILLVINIFFNITYIQATETEEIAQSFNTKDLISMFNEYMSENDIQEFNPNSIFNDLISGKELGYQNIIKVFLNNIFGQISTTLKDSFSLFIIVIICAILTNIELDKDSDVVKITKLILYISLATILLKNYFEIIVMFKDIVNKLSVIMQTVSTFLIGILAATGKLTSTSVIEPIILGVSNLICVIVEYIIIPFFNISLAISIVSKISENIKLDNLSKLFRKTSLYIFATTIGIFLTFLGMESTVTKSIDGLTYKTAQDVVSNYIPVVGDFLSDSLDTVIGSTKLIGKVGGVVSIISTIVIVSIPIIKLFAVLIIYNILISISEPINEDKNIIEFLKNFSGIYKDMFGILIGIMVLFVMSTGIIMSIIGNVGGG